MPTLYPATVGSTHNSAKKKKTKDEEERKKWIGAEGETFTPQPWQGKKNRIEDRRAISKKLI